MKHSMANTPENKVKKVIDTLLKQYEWITLPNKLPSMKMEWPFDVPQLSSNHQHKLMWWYKPQSGTFGRAGIPDYVGCIDGRMFGVEAKANGGKLTNLQQAAIKSIQESGGKVFVVHGVTNDKGHIAISEGYALLETWLTARHAAYLARHNMGLKHV